MPKARYLQAFRRRREGKTNYHRRRKLVASRRPFLYVYVADRNITAQISIPDKPGDRVLASVHSRELMRYGWRGSRKSTPAAYLVGFLLGKKAIGAHVKDAVLYTGMRGFIPGSRIAAVVKGARDAGLDVPASEGSLPDEGRTLGRHIAEYAEASRDRFSSMISSGFDPVDYPRAVEDVRSRIEEAFGG